MQKKDSMQHCAEGALESVVWVSLFILILLSLLALLFIGLQPMLEKWM